MTQEDDRTLSESRRVRQRATELRVAIHPWQALDRETERRFDVDFGYFGQWSRSGPRSRRKDPFLEVDHHL